MNMTNFEPVINLIYVLLLIGGIVGGIFAVRRGGSKEVQEAMQRLNETLDGEIKTLRRRVDDLEKERATQDRVIATIRYALKSYNLYVTISGDYVTLRDASGKSMTTPVQDRAKVAPITTTTGDNEPDAS